MSRCFPYPPPGYTLSRSVEEALIESIKLHKERLKVKEQRKERKKVKQEEKERKKERKEKKRERKDERKLNQEKAKLSADQYDSFKETATTKSIWANAEQLEKSGLSEELGQPICSLSISSESSEDSNKRKRPLLADDNRSRGKIIRIKLPSKKQDIPNVSSNCQVLSGRTDTPVQTKDISIRNEQGTSSCPSPSITGFGEATHRADNELTLSTSGKNDLVSPESFKVPCPEGSSMTSIQKQDLEYRNLMDNCVLPQFFNPGLSQDNLDWLLCSDNQHRRDVKRQKYDTDAISSLSSSSLMPPQACYIPQADVYALPYTIPF